MTLPLPLLDLTVVEIGTSVAAPVAGQILADLGARVLKVENPVNGDDARGWGAPLEGGDAPAFHTLNRNKLSVAVNLKDPEERQKLRDFIYAEADIVIQNLRPGLVDDFELNADILRTEKPELIYCNMTAFGATGPARKNPGYDPLMQACCGIMSVTGHEGDDPVRVGPSIVDQGAGMWAVIAILSALQERHRTGTGSRVDTSLYETAIAWMPIQFANFLASGKPPAKAGSQNPTLAPYRAYKVSDGWIVIAAGNDNLFARLCRALDTQSWLEDPRFETNKQRVQHRDELDRLVSDQIDKRSVADLRSSLDAVGVPNAPVLSVDQVVEDPQFNALGILQSVPSGPLPLIGLPIMFDGERPPLRAPSPKLGASDALVLDVAD